MDNDQPQGVETDPLARFRHWPGFLVAAIAVNALFILGIFWKKTTARAAWLAVLITIPVPVFLKWIFPSWPFLDNMALSFLIIANYLI